MFAYAPCYGKLAGLVGEVPMLRHVPMTIATKPGEFVLTTERMRVRPISRDDVDALHALWTIPAVRRYLWEDQLLPRAEVEAIIERSCESFDSHGIGFFALESKSSAGLIGFCGYRFSEDQVSEKIELLYGIHPDHWGEGLVAEAARAVLRHGFESCRVERVVAATDTPNQQAVRVLQKLGMVFEERRLFHGLDTVFYSMTRTDFEAIYND